MIKLIFGGIFIAFGALMLLGVSVNLSESALTVGDIVGALLLGVGPIAGGQRSGEHRATKKDPRKFHVGVVAHCTRSVDCSNCGGNSDVATTAPSP